MTLKLRVIRGAVAGLVGIGWRLASGRSTSNQKEISERIRGFGQPRHTSADSYHQVLSLFSEPCVLRCMGRLSRGLARRGNLGSSTGIDVRA
jgi:hypothetical protein